jgi:hypothetical protein
MSVTVENRVAKIFLHSVDIRNVSDTSSPSLRRALRNKKIRKTDSCMAISVQTHIDVETVMYSTYR